LSRFRAIVFDLDDTLYPEIDYVHSGFNGVARWVETQLNIAASDAIKEFPVTLTRASAKAPSMSGWRTEVSDPSTCHTNWCRCTEVTFRAISPFDGAPALLRRLPKNHRLGLLTDGDPGVQRRKLTRLRLSTLFDSIVFTGDYGRANCKPNSFGFRMVLNA
jgi:putative hydrolase of the HAD superfamily